MPTPTVEELRDQTWATCEALQALAQKWRLAGWPSAASGIEAAAEAAKSLIRATKNEK